MAIEHFTDPFDHWIVDDFITRDLAVLLSNDFLAFHSDQWFDYNNPLEVKRTLNNWWCFPPATYEFMEALNSYEFIDKLSAWTGIDGLYADPGLHGAGWHIHGNGGKLNVHLDYSIHPKLTLERKLNLILYLTPDWDPAWGGNLEFWKNVDGEIVHAKTIECKFNRMVLFDTTQDSWHGFPQPINCPPDKYRKSIAMYYLTEPRETADANRKRAKYIPTQDQKDDPAIESLIEQRMKLT